jgi:hypothetical protein
VFDVCTDKSVICDDDNITLQHLLRVLSIHELVFSISIMSIVFLSLKYPSGRRIYVCGWTWRETFISQPTVFKTCITRRGKRQKKACLDPGPSTARAGTWNVESINLLAKEHQRNGTSFREDEWLELMLQTDSTGFN